MNTKNVNIRALHSEEQEGVIDRLKALLSNGVVLFSYQKNDGTERVAYGTTSKVLTPTPPKDADDMAKALHSLVINGVGHGETIDKIVDIVGKMTAPPKVSDKEPDPDLQYYWDYEAQGLRVFKWSRVIGFVDIEKNG